MTTWTEGKREEVKWPIYTSLVQKSESEIYTNSKDEDTVLLYKSMSTTPTTLETELKTKETK